jgi:2-isopropylmalate synthase
VDITSPIQLQETHFVQRNGIEASVVFDYNGRRVTASDTGNGRLDAVSNAIRSYTGSDFNISTYTEHALEVGSASKAVSYVEIVDGSGNSFWGTGIDNDIITSSVKALISAVNNMLKEKVQNK